MELSSNFNGLANIAPTGKIPRVGKASALDWFDRLDAAVAAF